MPWKAFCADEGRYLNGAGNHAGAEAQAEEHREETGHEAVPEFFTIEQLEEFVRGDGESVPDPRKVAPAGPADVAREAAEDEQEFEEVRDRAAELALQDLESAGLVERVGESNVDVCIHCGGEIVEEDAGFVHADGRPRHKLCEWRYQKRVNGKKVEV